LRRPKVPQPPRVFEVLRADRRSPELQDRRVEGRSFAERIEASRKLGLEEGMKAGGESALAQIRDLVKALAEARAKLESEREGLLEYAVTDLARLSVKIAEKILGERLDSDPTVMIAVVRKSLETLKGCGAIEVRLNEEDMRKAAAAGAAPLAAEGLTIVADPAVPHGGCSIRTDWGSVGAGVTEQVQRVAAMFELESDGG
jgi:flagellar assembly protein FliH